MVELRNGIGGFLLKRRKFNFVFIILAISALAVFTFGRQAKSFNAVKQYVNRYGKVAMDYIKGEDPAERSSASSFAEEDPAEAENKDRRTQETRDNPGSQASGAAVDFPETLTVLDAGELEPVSVKKDPSLDSQSLGVVYGSLTNVEVTGRTVGGFSEIRARDYNSNKPITGFVPTKYLKEVPRQGDYVLVADLSDQKIYVYRDDVLDKTFVCSSGLDENNYATPVGIYRTGGKGESFYTPKYKEGAYNWVRFNKGYLIHSIPFDEDRNIIASERDKLGQKASHGCIRLALDDARWIYDNIPKGTMVIVQQ